MLKLTKYRWLMLGFALVPYLCGCQASRPTAGQTVAASSSPRPQMARTSSQRIIRVFTIFYQKPWLNLDARGDRDPEGLEYRVFLDPGSRKGVACDGTFKIAMYHVDQDVSGEVSRKLVSDWTYRSSEFGQIESPLLGRGYLVRLRWATKDIAGKEVEIVTRFENADGSSVSAGTKRLRVPKYAS